ncbi:TPA: D-ornithine--citrate ligase SfaD [Staphylococcus aureus]|uniref:D-ornithine--citrate ligase SfaD n=1 Tax=Staphylococcus aureus TaxID=1280 RepID=UPI0007C54096|nr:D-ornithine--citrate ligase SfaD [Staphylococcus aureus]MBU9769362.1 D-ornithine--citrate ligase SfnaD [Staphylococcus aureus]MCE5083427.1 D-ornithine--citrate ligase SfaD [Staphylococcus aureus]HDE0409946.1 D-ornithine--citrate ligase SfaD [Staphylococcus aureus]HDE0423549.1 D-ornithine--citrate ligase SfaD [Staphylococcus aureus]HDE0433496.1 D-ornithine--citrate ligase SfaD [Staphylococcus aureus]
MNLNLILKKQTLKFNKEEQETYLFLQQHNSDWANIFKEMILQGRDKVTQRLVTSMHRENLVKARTQSKKILSRDLIMLDISTTHILEIQFPQAKQTLYAPITGEHAFDRIDVEGPFYIKDDITNTITRVHHPNEILECILIEVPDLKNAASDQFQQDLINSATNMTFAISYQALSMQHDSAPLFNIIENSEDSYLRSEQAVIEGHPLHPGAKLRKGLNALQTFLYSSEFNQPIKLKIVLIHSKLSRTMSLSKDYDTTVHQLFPDLIKQLENEFTPNFNFTFNDYHIMIVHPWQLDDVLHSDYQAEVDKKLIIEAKHTLDYYAGLSFRTLVPKYPAMSPHIKLSTNVHITGEIRTLSEQTTHNGPLMTRILNDILEKDVIFKSYASTIIDEVAGIHFYNEQDEADYQTERSEQLGTLFRKNIYQMIPQEVTPMIPSSLVATYPFNNESPIVTLIKRYQSAASLSDFESSAKSWVETYSKALLGLVIPLVTKYGIALEAHLQNAIATFRKDGLLDTMYIRDFEGLRIDKAQLNEMGYSTSHFHEKSRILTDSKTSVFNKAFYSTVQNHLGELILTISKASNDSNLERHMWYIVRDVLDNIFDQLVLSTHKSNQVNENRINEIKDTMFAPFIDYKCVTTMRLEDEAHHYTYIKVNNPLYRENN